MIKKSKAIEHLYHHAEWLIEKITTLEDKNGELRVYDRTLASAIKRALFEMGIPEHELPMRVPFPAAYQEALDESREKKWEERSDRLEARAKEDGVEFVRRPYDPSLQ